MTFKNWIQTLITSVASFGSTSPKGSRSANPNCDNNMTINNCKFCKIEIPIPKLGTDYWCIHCQKYSLICLESGTVEVETLREGNYHLCFFPTYKEANVVETGDEGRKIMKTFELEELTHDEAVHWVEKLKTYSIFQ
jgi:hypothetical protein